MNWPGGVCFGLGGLNLLTFQYLNALELRLTMLLFHPENFMKD